MAACSRNSSSTSASNSMISDPIRLVLETTTNANANTSSASNNKENGGAAAKNFTKYAKSKKTTKKAMMIGGTSTINSSHYVDFCSDPTTGFAEFSMGKAGRTTLASGRREQQMLSPWLDPHLSPTNSAAASSSSVVIIEGGASAADAPTTGTSTGTAEAVESSTIILPASITSPPASLQPSIPPQMPPIRTTIAADLVSNNNNGNNNGRRSRNPLFRNPLLAQPHPHHQQLRVPNSNCTFSSSSFSLRPWEWPRRLRPVRSAKDRDELHSNQLFFCPSAPSSSATGTATPQGPSLSSYTTCSYCTSRSSGSGSCSGSSSSTSSSSATTPNSCPIHSTRRGAAGGNSSGSAVYYLSKYGTNTTGMAGAANSHFGGTSRRGLLLGNSMCNSRSFCCRKSNKFSATTTLARTNKGGGLFGLISGSGTSNGSWSNSNKRQALRTFQLICSILCALGIIALLVISLLSSVKTTIVLPAAAVQNEEAAKGAEQVVIGHRILSNGDQDDVEVITEENLEFSLQDQLKSWLFRHPSSFTYFNSPASFQNLTSAPSQLLNITDFRFLLNNEDICSGNGGSGGGGGSGPFPNASSSGSADSSKIYFMILVHSAPTHFQQRQAIRSTWGSVKSIKNLGIRLVFLLGEVKPPASPSGGETIKFTRSNPINYIQRSIQNEHALYGDIIQGNFPDTYHNLIYKHLMGYKWILKYCASAVTFVLKTDDDVFIDIFQLVEFTTRTYGLRPFNTMICNVYEGTSPIRALGDTAGGNVSGPSKWAVTRDEYPLEIYPKYCGGLAYLITPDVLANILAVNEAITEDMNKANVSLKFWIDDVYVTGVLRELTGRQPYYLNLRYAYDSKQYQPWMMNDLNEDGVREEDKIGERGKSFAERGAPPGGGSSSSSGNGKPQDDTDNLMKKIPYMIVHLEQTNMLNEEMNRLWRKTMRVWH